MYQSAICYESMIIKGFTPHSTYLKNQIYKAGGQIQNLSDVHLISST